MPDIVISDKIYELTKLIYKDPEILYPIDLSLEFLSPKITCYFKEGFKQGVVSEIAGTTGSGKTLFLFLLLLYNSQSLFSCRTNKAKVVYFDFLHEFNFDFRDEFFKSNSHLQRIELRQEMMTLSQFNENLSLMIHCIAEDNIKYLFIDNFDFLLSDVDNEKEIIRLEENFYRLTHKGVGIVYTCKLKKMYENRVSSYIDVETDNKEKLELIALESTISSKYFKQTKRNRIMLYSHSGMRTNRAVLLMFEKGIYEKTKYYLKLDWFNFKSFKNNVSISQKYFDTD